MIFIKGYTKLSIIFSFVLIIFVGNSVSVAQNHMLYVDNRFGVPVSAAHETMIKRNDFSLKYDVGTLIGYEYKLFKKTNTFLYSALEVSNAHYNFKTYLNYNNIFEIDNIDFKRRRNVIHLGLRQGFSFYEDQLQIGFGFGIAKRFFPEKTSNSYGASFHYDETSYVGFEYLVTTFHDGLHLSDGFIPNRQILDFDTDLFVSLKINSFLNVKLSFMYNRNHQVHYLLLLKRRNPMTFGKPTTIHNGNTGLNDSKDYIRNDIFYSCIGIVINLNELNLKLKGND